MARPKWKTEETIRAGVAINQLAAKYRSELEPRLAAGVIDGLMQDVDALRGKTSDASQARSEQKSATAGQAQALEMAVRFVSTCRESVRRAFPSDKRVQKRFGIGDRVNPKAVGAVATALQKVLAAAEADPDSTRGAGLLPADAERMRSVLSNLLGADTAQEGKKVSAKQATAARVTTQLRVERAIDLIAAAAVIAFLDRPEIADSFRAAMPIPPSRSKSAAKSPSAATA